MRAAVCVLSTALACAHSVAAQDGAQDGALAARTATIGLPLFHARQPLREVVVRIAGLEAPPSIRKAGLAEALAGIVRPDALARVAALPETDGFVTIAALAEAGLRIEYDPALLRLTYRPAANSARRQTIRIGRGGVSAAPLVPNAEAATASGHVNFRNALRYDHDDDDLRLRTGLDGAIRVGGVVVEAVGALDSRDGAVRAETRVVHDMPARSARLSAGDVFVEPVGFQSGGILGGVQLQKTLADEQINRTLRSRGGTSFRLERRATVEVYVNDRLRRRLTLDAGEYDIEDLTLTDGQNSVRIRIEDKDGRIEEQVFTVFFDRTLLAPGESEYGAALGVASTFAEGGRDYDTDRVIGSGFYRRGVTGYLTLGANGQIDDDGGMGGAEVLAATSFGAIGLDLAASHSGLAGFGYAADLDAAVDEVVFLGPDRTLPGSMNLSFSYFDEAFHRIGGGAPDGDLMLRAAASYNQILGERTSMTLFGGYDRFRRSDDGFFAQAGAYHRLSSDLSVNGGVGYRSVDEETYAFLGLSYRFGPDVNGSARYDTRRNTAEFGITRTPGDTVGSVSAAAFLRHSDDDASFSGEAGYIGNRFIAGVSHDGGGTGLDDLDGANVTGARLDTALAFAGGAVALGRPVTDSFVILETHASLDGSEVSIRDIADGENAASDGLGPAVYPVGGDYRTRRIAYEIDPWPIGYTDGESEFRIRPGFRSGFRLTVGSDYNMTATGTALDAAGEPLRNLLGIAREVDGGSEDRTLDIFTNGAGRFAMQGLRPGRWEVVFPTEPPLRTVVAIPAGETAFIRLGALRQQPPEEKP